MAQVFFKLASLFTVSSAQLHLGSKGNERAGHTSFSYIILFTLQSKASYRLSLPLAPLVICKVTSTHAKIKDNSIRAQILSVLYKLETADFFFFFFLLSDFMAPLRWLTGGKDY